jgi:hypothetical protein
LTRPRPEGVPDGVDPIANGAGEHEIVLLFENNAKAVARGAWAITGNAGPYGDDVRRIFQTMPASRATHPHTDLGQPHIRLMSIMQPVRRNPPGPAAVQAMSLDGVA